MESKPGEYKWSSALERLKTRSSYYLHKLPEYFEVNNWWAYLTENLDLEAIWSSIRSSTINGKPIGNIDFLTFIKVDSLRNEVNLCKAYGIP